MTAGGFVHQDRRSQMQPREIVDLYYKHANNGDWNSWCDLFAEDTVLDEQLAGHVEGLSTLREMMAGFPTLYASFSNVARNIVVDGDQAGVVSHLSATTPAGKQIEAEVMNYFRFADGRIAYMSNFHDTVPFRAASES
jgi:ketosteroid isomerase-like protein